MRTAGKSARNQSAFLAGSSRTAPLILLAAGLCIEPDAARRPMNQVLWHPVAVRPCAPHRTQKLRSHGLDSCQKRNVGVNLLTHALPNTTACNTALIMKSACHSPRRQHTHVGVNKCSYVSFARSRLLAFRACMLHASAPSVRWLPHTWPDFGGCLSPPPSSPAGGSLY